MSYIKDTGIRNKRIENPNESKRLYDMLVAMVQKDPQKESTTLAIIEASEISFMEKLLVAHRLGLTIGNKLGLDGKTFSFVK